MTRPGCPPSLFVCHGRFCIYGSGWDTRERGWQSPGGQGLGWGGRWQYILDHGCMTDFHTFHEPGFIWLRTSLTLFFGNWSVMVMSTSTEVPPLQHVVCARSW